MICAGGWCVGPTSPWCWYVFFRFFFFFCFSFFFFVISLKHNTRAHGASAYSAQRKHSFSAVAAKNIYCGDNSREGAKLGFVKSWSLSPLGQVRARGGASWRGMLPAGKTNGLAAANAKRLQKKVLHGCAADTAREAAVKKRRANAPAQVGPLLDAQPVDKGPVLYVKGETKDAPLVPGLKITCTDLRFAKPNGRLHLQADLGIAASATGG